MILSITFNPALDITGMVDSLIPNEKSYVYDERRFAGGNGINAGRIAHRLGAKIMHTGFLGGSTGEEIASMIEDEKMSHHFIDIKAHTRMNLTVSNSKTHEQTRLSFPGPKISSKEWQQFLNYLMSTKPSLVIMGGSLPPGINAGHVNRVVAFFKQMNVSVFVDMPGGILKDVLSSKPDFIKPNLTEFQEMSGKKVTSISEVLKLARQRPEIGFYCISSVEGGALMVSPEGAWFGKIPKVKIYSTVGAGDSMVGAIGHCFLKMKPTERASRGGELLQWGLAAACATLVNPGLTMGSRKSIKEYYPLIKIRDIKS
jgi:1-phosphofructokinase family hexose kinase